MISRVEITMANVHTAAIEDSKNSQKIISQRAVIRPPFDFNARCLTADRRFNIMFSEIISNFYSLSRSPKACLTDSVSLLARDLLKHSRALSGLLVSL